MMVEKIILVMEKLFLFFHFLKKTNMNYLPILLLGFTNVKNADISITAKNVIKMMTGNKNFPTIQDNVVELAAIYELFLNSILAPDDQSQATRDILKMNRQKLNVQLKSVGNLVMGIAKGDVEKLLTSGYKLKEKSTARPIPNAPLGVVVYMANTQGVLVAMCKKVEGADNYIARLSTDKINWNWTNFENGVKVMLENVPTNQLLYVQMQAKNAAGRSNWSNVIETYLPSKDIPMIKQMNVSNSTV